MRRDLGFYKNPRKGEIISVAVSSNYLLAAATRTRVLIWNMFTGNELAKINCTIERCFHPGVIFSPDGKLLASTHNQSQNPNSAVAVWDSWTGTTICSLNILQSSKTRIGAIMFGLDGKHMVCGETSHRSLRNDKTTIGFYGIPGGQKFRMLEGLKGLARSLSHFGTHLVCCSDDGRVTIWDAAGNHVSSHHITKPKMLSRVVATHDGKFAAYDGIHNINRFDCKSEELDVRRVTVSNKLTGLAFSPGLHEDLCLACSPGTHEIAFAGGQGLIGLWDPRKMTVKRPKIVYKEDHTTAIALSSDGKVLVHASVDMKIRVWNVQVEGYCVRRPSQPAMLSGGRRFGDPSPDVLYYFWSR